jgi:Aspartate-semialdehyde dehydrogenase
MNCGSKPRGLYAQQERASEVFPHQIAFNCLPHIGEFEPDGYATEELKLMRESKKILGDPQLKITATAVRVPVFSSHAESVNLQMKRPCSAEEVRELLRSSPGVIVVDDPSEQLYPLQQDAAGTDATFVGRIRKDDTVEHGMNLWIVADNLRKGAALNAVQIAEVVIDSWGREELH